MVLRRRLVPEKSPMISTLSPPKVPVAEGSKPLIRISSISDSSAMTLANAVPPRVMTISGVLPLKLLRLLPPTASQAARV
jgi:hypothetical protein